MWLQATITREDLAKFADTVFPIRIALSGERMLYLGKPRSISFSPGRGVRVETHARIKWPMLGMHVPLDITRATALLIPAVEHEDGEDTLTFRLHISDFDLAMAPTILQGAIVHRINEAIGSEGAVVKWRFRNNLTFDIPVPAKIEPVRRVHIACAWGEVRVTEEGVTLVGSFRATASKGELHEDHEPAQAPAIDGDGNAILARESPLPTATTPTDGGTAAQL